MPLPCPRHLSVFVFAVLAVFTLTACFDMEARKQRHFERGVELFEAGDDVRARLEFRNVLQIDDRHASAWYWMGRLEERGGDFRRAFANYNRAVELDESLVSARVRRGQIHLLAGEVDAAELDSVAALALAPEDPDVLMLRAGVRFRSGNPGWAEEDARTALLLKPGHAGASVLMAENLMQRGDLPGAFGLLERAIEANPDAPELRLILGGYLESAGEVDRAIGALRELVNAHPESIDYRNRLAGYLLAHGRAAEAEQALRDALAQAPDDAERQQALIEFVAQLRGLEDALEEVAALRAARPGNVDLRLLEARLLMAAQRADEAEVAYRGVIDASGGRGPAATQARTLLAAMLAPTRADEAAELVAQVLAESPSEADALQVRAALALRRGEPEQAIADLRTVLRDFPDRIAPQRMLGQAHAAKGEAALAEDAFERAIRMDPTDSLAYLQLAELRVRNGDNEGALVVLESLLARVPENEAAQQAIARIHLFREDWDALARTAEAVRRTHPEHALGFYLNGLVLQQQGEHAGAVAALEEALERAPDSLEPLVALLLSQLALGQGGEAARTALRLRPEHETAASPTPGILLQRGDLPAAIALLERAIEANPGILELRLILGASLDSSGDVEGAVRALRGLVEADPESVDYRSRLVGYLVEHGRTAEAEQVLRDALAQAPDNAERQQALIEFVAQLRGPEGALEEVVALRAARPDNVDLRLLEARLLAAAQRADEAEAAYRGVIDASGGRGPVAIRARTLLAAMLAPTRADEAAALVAQVLAESPSEADALEVRAALALRQGEPERAIADLRTVLRDFPDRIAPQRMLGQAHAAKGEAAPAEDAFERAIRMDPADSLAYLQLVELRVRNGDNQGALVVLENLLARMPENEALQRAISRIQFSSSDWDALAQTAEAVRRTHPEHALGFYLRGLVLQRQGKHEEAVAVLEEALERGPDALESVIALARSQLALGRSEEAAQRVRGVLERNPNNVVAMNLLADVYAGAGQFAQARAGYQEAIRLHPRSTRAYGRLALLEESQGHPAAAVAVLERGAQETGRSAIIVFQLATALERAGDLDGAMAAYEAVLREHPQVDVAANNLAYLMATHRGGPADLDRALELAQRFAGSEVPAFLDTLGWIRYLRGEYEAARPLLERAVELDSDLDAPRYHLGLTYARLGMVEEAREHLAHAAAAEGFAEGPAAGAALRALE